jgi:hypothetical protein
MTSEMMAALISLLGALLLMAMGNLVTTAFFAGRLTERLENVTERVANLESSERATALEAARARAVLDDRS